ncbi:MAG: preprotein translocase subunit SecG [Deltaproteobacteria bacterium]|nr:preprotein translocase subunit SecG [Deltaproteobacteria bacterium]MBI2230168.1 preprotein translocase subunit SecG [Deltaproteobacteria bacterium]MBI2367680.1 preprotein translocase subunit SecG [Deltaproteobacteria bacterium]MBI3066619.1 preprotein translocase subunit SecG [Deltaproteobacteria bacterium]
MIIVITIIHVIVSIGLILVVLLQTGKGAEVGAVFGGSSATIFGSSGAGNFLTKLTSGMAIVFMFTSLALGYFAGRKPSATIFDSRTPVTAPAAPAQPTTPASEPKATAPSAPQATPPQNSKSP